MSAKVGKSGNVPESLNALSFAEQTLFNQIVFPLIDANTIAPQIKPPQIKPPADDRAQYRTFEGFAAVGIPVTDISDINSDSGLVL